MKRDFDKPPLAPIDMLESSLPREEIPEIVDGRISFLWASPFSKGDRNVISAETSSASLAERLLYAIEYIRENDPDFLSNLPDVLLDGALVELTLALHIIGFESDLNRDWVSRIQDIELLRIRAEQLFNEIKGNQYYPFDFNFGKSANTLVKAYILHKINMLSGACFASNETLSSILRFASEFDLTPDVLEIINTRTPLPSSIQKMHREGMLGMDTILWGREAYGDDLSKSRKHFSDLSMEKNAAVMQFVLDILAESYGIYPPPKFEWGDTIKSDADHQIWNEDKAECFYHPLGKIRLKPKPDLSFDEALESICHEFCHGLEDLSLFLLNPDFQQWFEKEGDAHGIKVGSPAIQSHLRASGLSISFNNCSLHPAFNTDFGRPPYYLRGAYYQAANALDISPEDVSRRKKQDTIYVDQLRERHAFFYQYILANRIKASVEIVTRCPDPVSGIMLAQNMYDPIIKEMDLIYKTVVPDDQKDKFIKEKEKIRILFWQADKRGNDFSTSLHINIKALKASALLLNSWPPEDIMLSEATKDIIDAAIALDACQRRYEHSRQYQKNISPDGNNPTVEITPS